MAGVIPQPSLRAERAHRKEKGNVAAPSSDRVCKASRDAGSVGPKRGSEGRRQRDGSWLMVAGGRGEKDECW